MPDDPDETEGRARTAALARAQVNTAKREVSMGDRKRCLVPGCPAEAELAGLFHRAVGATRRQREESGWLIERHQNSRLEYWNGRPSVLGLQHDHSGAWSIKHEDAIRFAREEDASVVLAWVLGGHGRVNPSYPPPPSAPSGWQNI